MAKKHECPNCVEVFTGSHPQTGCALALLAAILRERGEYSQAKINKLVVDCNVDLLWDRLGRLIDDFGYGDFSYEGDDE